MFWLENPAIVRRLSHRCRKSKYISTQRTWVFCGWRFLLVLVVRNYWNTGNAWCFLLLYTLSLISAHLA